MRNELEKPLVSIITPTYNRGPVWLWKAILSVKSQSYPHFEHIIIEDGGTDNSEDVARGMYLGDDRLIYIKRKENSGGCCIPRNEGRRLAKGKYIANLDSDNQYMPEFLSEMVDFIEKTKSDCVYCGRTTRGSRYDMQYSFIEDYSPTKPPYHGVDNGQLLYTKEISDKIGDFFVPHSCDYEFCKLIAKNGGKFAGLNKPLFIYWWHDSNRQIEIKG